MSQQDELVSMVTSASEACRLLNEDYRDYTSEKCTVTNLYMACEIGDKLGSLRKVATATIKDISELRIEFSGENKVKMDKVIATFKEFIGIYDNILSKLITDTKAHEVVTKNTIKNLQETVDLIGDNLIGKKIDVSEGLIKAMSVSHYKTVNPIKSILKKGLFTDSAKVQELVDKMQEAHDYAVKGYDIDEIEEYSITYMIKDTADNLTKTISDIESGGYWSKLEQLERLLELHKVADKLLNPPFKDKMEKEEIEALVELQVPFDKLTEYLKSNFVL